MREGKKVRTGGKQNKWKREEGKELRNLLAALLIELPQHFSRGWLARRLDGLIRMHTHIYTHTHAQAKREKRDAATHTQIGNASDKLSSVVFFDKFD